MPARVRYSFSGNEKGVPKGAWWLWAVVIPYWGARSTLSQVFEIFFPAHFRCSHVVSDYVGIDSIIGWNNYRPDSALFYVSSMITCLP